MRPLTLALAIAALAVVQLVVAGVAAARRGALGRAPAWQRASAAGAAPARASAPAAVAAGGVRRRDVRVLVGVDGGAAGGLLEADVGELDRARGRLAGAAEAQLELADVGEVDALGGEVARAGRGSG